MICVYVCIRSFQVQQAPISKAVSGAKYVTFAQSIKSIHAEEGLKSFWRFVQPPLYLFLHYYIASNYTY